MRVLEKRLMTNQEAYLSIIREKEIVAAQNNNPEEEDTLQNSL